MSCAQCGHEPPAGSGFCNHCGAKLTVACPGCGVTPPPGSRFCNECGTPLGAPSRQPTPSIARDAPSAAPQSDARKIVTILFADLAGSTALHERLDPESVRSFMESYYAAMRAAIDAHGGTLVKLLGDGVMAAFGVPHVAEDDAIRAVHAGTAMQQAFRQLAREHADIDLRVAINTGEVVVGTDNADVLGDPVNVAARLQQEARAGDVVVGETTRRLVAAHVTLEPLGSFTLRGRAEQVKAYRLVSLERPSRVATAAFVGRSMEMGRITAIFDAAVAQPAARLAVLLGSPGLGKSRLIAEITSSLGDNATAVFAQCDAAGGKTFAPIAGALRELLGAGLVESGDATDSAGTLRSAVEAAIPTSDAERLRIASGIAALLVGSPASPEETFFVIRRFLTGLAQNRPVVLVIDDLHWAEPLLLDLVEHLVQWGSGVPLLVLIGARPELRDLRSSLVTRGGIVSDVITLVGLDAGAAMQLAASVIGASDLPATVVAKVLSTTEGNPLFVGELVRMLVDEGALERQGDRWIIGANLAALEMPPTIHALLAARIERLRPEERTVLEHASVVGRHFSRSAVCALLGLSGSELDARLETLRRTELIEPDTGWFLGEPVLRFHHVLIRDAAYRRLLKGKRAELHAQLAEWIEAKVRDAPEHDETVGHHLEQAHRLLSELGQQDQKTRMLGERAANRLAAAGRRALGGDDVPLAANLLGRAIARLDAGDTARAELALDWCEALLSAGDVAQAKTAIAELSRFTTPRAADLTTADETTAIRRLSAWHVCFTGQLTVLTSPQGLQDVAGSVSAASKELASLGDSAGEAKAHFVHALALARLGKVGSCEGALDRALAAARGAGDRRRANTVLAIAPIAALWGPSPVTRASGRCLDVVRVLRITQGAPAVEAVALSCQGVLEALRGRTEAARRMITSAHKMVEELGITQRVLEADVSAGLVELLEGDAPAAERNLRGAYEGLRDLGLGIGAAQASALLARALLAQNRDAEAEALSYESELLAGDDLKAAIAWRGVRAEALARRGEHDAAVELATAAVELASATDALLDHADARLALAAALRAAGRDAEADAEERRARELWDAKGATLLAERAPRPAVSAGPTIATAAAQPPTAVANTARSGRRFTRNFAVQNRDRIASAIAAADVQALDTVYRSDVEVIDHLHARSYGYDGVRELMRLRIVESETATLPYEPLATLGESLLVCRVRSTSTGSTVGTATIGATDVPYIEVINADEAGRARRIYIFGEDKLGEAIVCLYERYAELQPDGPARNRAAQVARSVAAYDGPFNPDRLASELSPGFRFIDHRPLATWSARDPNEFVKHWRLQRDLAPDVAQRFEDVLACTLDALLVRVTAFGTGRDSGGAFENRTCCVLTFAPDGRSIGGELFEAECEAEARARFDEITTGWPPRAVRRRVRPNAATVATDRISAVVERRDASGLDHLVHDSFVEIDHPTGSTYGKAEATASIVRLLRSDDVSYNVEPLAILGPLMLGRRRIHASGAHGQRFDVGEYENHTILVAEVDENGIVVRHEVFAPDRLGQAITRLYELYAEREPEGPERSRALGIARSAIFGGPIDLDHMEASLAPSSTNVDHRVFSTWSAQNREEFMQHWRQQAVLTTGFSARTDDVLALEPDTALIRSTYFGTSRQSGGAFENPLCLLFEFGADGIISSCNTFEAEQEVEALAHFDEMIRSKGARLAELRATSAPTEHPFANVASRAIRTPSEASSAGEWTAALRKGNAASEMMERWRATFDVAFATGDWSAMRALCAPAMVFDDRRRLALISGDSELLIASARERVAIGARPEMRIVGAAGERVILQNLLWSGGPPDGRFEIEYLSVQEADEAGRLTAIVLFDNDVWRDAQREAWKRWAAIDPSVESITTALGRLIDAWNAKDRDLLHDAHAANLVVEDHRHDGIGHLEGSQAYLAAVTALWSLAPDLQFAAGSFWLATAANGGVFHTRRIGMVPGDGGAYQSDYLVLMLVDSGRISHFEFFETVDADAALARFDELRTDPGSARIASPSALARN
ncbi:MAG TPA: adenylate/guanylate cyclase domain-containing protein [Candidatus Binatia bacterium]|jgi:class 3 adenylate cyclase/tetratricopeptide (TPR) repeat protein